MQINREIIEQIKKQYPPGTRIELISMSDPYAPIQPGTQGVVSGVDDIGQLHMLWSNGRTLAVIPGEDNFKVIPQQDVNPEREVVRLYSPLSAIYYCPDPDDEYHCSTIARELPSDSLAGAEKEITQAITKWIMPDESERGLFLGYDRGLALKVHSTSPAVQLVNGELWGVGIFHLNEPLSENEMLDLKNWWQAEVRDLVQEDFSRVGISCAYGEIFVHFMGDEEKWNMFEESELPSDVPQIGGQSL